MVQWQLRDPQDLGRSGRPLYHDRSHQVTIAPWRKVLPPARNRLHQALQTHYARTRTHHTLPIDQREPIRSW